jgi:hypothetical protein
VTEPVIGGALVAILENIVRLVDFLETVLAILVTRIPVRVMLHGEFAERRLELGLGRGAGHAENFVVVALGHPAAALSYPRQTSRTRFGGPTYPQTCTPGQMPGGDAFAAGLCMGSKPMIRRISFCRRRPR